MKETLTTKNKNTITHSIKWSSLAESSVKLITPVTMMILARLLTPDAFGIIAVCNMIIYFADILADAGFAKYIIQADFKNEAELNKYATVAFWSHLALSLTIWTFVSIFSFKLASFLGIVGHEDVIVISTLQLVLMSMISIQTGIIRRRFEFKKSFIARITTTIIIFIITVPVALCTRSFWSLIIGHLGGYLANAIILIWLTHWLPSFYYSFHLLKRMFSFSFWSMMEGLAHWFIFWFDVFVVTQFFTTYLVGLYKNSTSIILSFITMITASISPVLLSTLSRLKNNDSYVDIYMNSTKLLMYLVLPVCTLIYFCRNFVTFILLGPQWSEGAIILGCWALMLGISVFIYSFPAEIYKSKGIPKYLFYYQLSYIVLMVPLCIYAATLNFWIFVYVRCLSILIQVVLFFIFSYKILHWKPLFIFSYINKPLLTNIIFFILCLCAFWYVKGMYSRVFIGVIMALLYGSFIYLKLKDDLIKSKDMLIKKEINNELTK